ncbi:hypothetical protein [uncultured Methanomethylovorans sp.]|nr:hypothetical protein [uncultured Methanomethylovorans sp.]
MKKSYRLKNYTVLDKRRFNLLVWNMAKSWFNSTEQVPSPSVSSRI